MFREVEGYDLPCFKAVPDDRIACNDRNILESKCPVINQDTVMGHLKCN